MKKVYEVLEIVADEANQGSFYLEAMYITGSDTFEEAEDKLLRYGGMPHKKYIIVPVYKTEI